MNKFHLTDMAVKMYCPDNVMELDDAGLPSIMVYIPAFKNSDVLNGGDDSTHPAFIVKGEQIDGFYFSKFQNVVHNSKAYSLPGEDPKASLSFDIAREYCEAKGHGWHLSTAAEWAAIALWCKKNGFLPYGNNAYGKDSRETEYKAIPSSTEISRVATGTGPLTWSHDGTASGIWDMNGNVWEWLGGMRVVWGELQILANNDAADPDIPQNDGSAYWKAINATNGMLVSPEADLVDYNETAGKTVRLDYVNGAWTFTTFIENPSADARSCTFDKVTCSPEISEPAKILLRALAILPDTDTSESTYESDRVYWNNNVAERLVYRGGRSGSGAESGIFSLSCSERTTANANTGFRASYIPGIISGDDLVIM